MRLDGRLCRPRCLSTVVSVVSLYITRVGPDSRVVSLCVLSLVHCLRAAEGGVSTPGASRGRDHFSRSWCRPPRISRFVWARGAGVVLVVCQPRPARVPSLTTILFDHCGPDR